MTDMLARGLDLSRYNDPTRQDLADWRSLGFCIGFYSVGIGLNLDPLAARHRDNLLATGYLTAPYQALYEDDPPEDQAQLLVSRHTSAQIPLLLADWERPKLTGAMIRAFYTELRRLSKLELWVYTNQSRWYQYFPTRRSREWAVEAGLGLLVAGYPFDRSDYDADGRWQGQLMDAASIALRSTPPTNRRPDLPEPWLREDGWQHSGHGRLPFYGRDLDLQVYQGTEAELRTRFSATPLPVPAPRLTDAERAIIHQAALDLRAAAAGLEGVT